MESVVFQPNGILLHSKAMKMEGGIIRIPRSRFRWGMIGLARGHDPPPIMGSTDHDTRSGGRKAAYPFRDSTCVGRGCCRIAAARISRSEARLAAHAVSSAANYRDFTLEISTRSHSAGFRDLGLIPKPRQGHGALRLNRGDVEPACDEVVLES